MKEVIEMRDFVEMIKTEAKKSPYFEKAVQNYLDEDFKSYETNVDYLLDDVKISIEDIIDTYTEDIEAEIENAAKNKNIENDYKELVAAIRKYREKHGNAFPYSNYKFTFKI